MRYRRQLAGAGAVGLWILIGLVFAIGVGSGLFHSVATRWAMIADVAPITLYLFFYLGYLLRACFGWDWTRVAAGYAGFVAVSAVLSLIPPELFNDSQSYLGAFVALVALAVAARERGRRPARLLLLAAATFALSLTFRSIDLAVCGAFPSGTHFLWHSLNGLLLFLATDAAIELRARARDGAIC